ncbi:ABC transporter substrate-binding protein [Filifactor villosus]|uniref:ABC transporter substrate-binding protein n=1 Tax=Filifactor villosus TaxID=29374 RepID=A0ABV9QJA5_9FIRM
MARYINVKDKVGEILEKYPETLEVFVVNGFEQLKNPTLRKAMANSVTLETALKMKKVNAELFCEKLEDAIRQEREGIDQTLREEGSFAQGDVRIEGVLPCPIRIPLLENFTKELEKIQPTLDKKIGYDLRAASMGMDWIKEQVVQGKEELLPDMMLSAGFDLFFDKKYMGQFNDKGIFCAPDVEFNRDFCNDNIDLRDPKKEYSIIGVVPAIIMVNERLLGGRKMPQGWEDILSPEFENTLALPMHDLDLFNAVIIHIYKMYAEEGINNLARSFQKSLHPAQMVKSKGLLAQSAEPVISISPYFFTQILPENGPIKPVWPKEGAIVSPIFLIAKKEKEELKPFLDYFLSKEVGEIFSANGKFPSTNCHVDNKLTGDQGFCWVGWDYIHDNNVGEILERCEAVFKELVQ